jgi:hypothetical protein
MPRQEGLKWKRRKLIMTYRGHIQNGMVVFDEAVALPEGTEVQVALPPPAEKASEGKPHRSLAERLAGVKGVVPGMPPDASRNKDHYLYGLPKQ